MKVIREINQMRAFVHQAKTQRKSIGFVPTMGALHEGHLSLIRQSKSENDLTICSIFVNPVQFNDSEDLLKYPRNLEADLTMLEELNCELVFHPSADAMYPAENPTAISFGYLEEIMEGKFRPGHFKGVGLVVSKLFNIIKPDRAYFGEKDLQQLTIIKIMTASLNFEIEIVPVPTKREADGLAMSSRNQLLTKEERKHAADLFSVLKKAKDKLINNESIKSVESFVEDFFEHKSQVTLEYFEIVNSADLCQVTAINSNQQVSLCIAGYLGKVRLIDNLSLR